MEAQRFGRVLAVVVMVAVSASALASCGDFERNNTEPVDPQQVVEPEKPTAGGHLVYGLESDPNGLDPTRNAWDNAGIQLGNALYDPLVAFNDAGVPRPYLAESMVPNAAFTSWTIKLRPGVVFHDGDPLNAAAVVTFLDALRLSVITGPPAQLLADVQRIDDLTVKVVTSRPWATLPALLSGQGGYVISPKQLADKDGTSKPVGTGPFMLRKWTLDQKFELIRNPRYWRAGLPYLDAVDFVVVNEGRQRLEQLERGDLDVTALTSPWDLQAVDQAMAQPTRARGLVVERDRGDAEKNSVLLNTSKPPLNDLRVRRALAYATDIRAIATANGWPLDRLAAGPIDPASPYFVPADYPSFNPDKARALVREYVTDSRVRPRVRQVTFTLRSADMNAKLVNDLVSQWAAVGINVKLDFIDPKAVVRFAVLGDFEAMILRYFAAVDPDVLWHFFVADTLTLSGISLNFARFRDAEITAGMNAGRATLSVPERRAAYARAQRAFADQVPYLWLNRSEWRVVSSRRVRDAHNVTLPDSSPAMPLVAGTYRLTETWLQN